MSGQGVVDRKTAIAEATGRVSEAEAQAMRQPERLDDWRDVLIELVEEMDEECAELRGSILGASGAEAESLTRQLGAVTSKRRALRSRLREVNRLRVERDRASAVGVLERIICLLAYESWEDCFAAVGPDLWEPLRAVLLRGGKHAAAEMHMREVKAS